MSNKLPTADGPSIPPAVHHDAAAADARATAAPAAPAPTPAPPQQVLGAGGNGKDGVLAVLGAEGTPLLQTARGGVGVNDALKNVTLQVGGGQVAGVVRVFDRSGKQNAHLDGSNGSLGLRSQLSIGEQVILGATSNRSTFFLGAPDRPAFVQLTTGGNPGPTITIDGERNAMRFLNKGTNTESVVELDGSSATVMAGGVGKGGTVTVRAADAKASIELQGASAAVQVGGNGRNGTVSVRGADGTALLELLARGNESAIGIGQANRPGRISMFSAKGEAIRLDAASGDIALTNADCAEEFDMASADIEPGSVVVIGPDGRLAACAEAFDTRVAGVVSGAGAYRPALVLDRRDTDSPRLPVALMGKVYCWVDAGTEPVAPGDLLTTAPRRGHAMKASNAGHAGGAIIGKALAPLAGGRGLLPILVAMR